MLTVVREALAHRRSACTTLADGLPRSLTPPAAAMRTPSTVIDEPRSDCGTRRVPRTEDRGPVRRHVHKVRLIGCCCAAGASSGWSVTPYARRAVRRRPSVPLSMPECLVYTVYLSTASVGRGYRSAVDHARSTHRLTRCRQHARVCQPAAPVALRCEIRRSSCDGLDRVGNE